LLQRVWGPDYSGENTYLRTFIRHLRRKLEPLARRISFPWIRAAVKKVDELMELIRRNIQKTIALDDLIVELRAA